jgi:glycosyltransferase involved in cell wall biosynthesis
MVPVLLVSSSAKAAGSERVHLTLARRLPAFGFDPTPVLFESGPLAEWLSTAGRPATVIEVDSASPLRKATRAVPRLRSFIRETGARAVFSSQSNTHIYAGLAAMSLGVPAAWWQHGSAAPSLRERVAAAIPAAAVICSSEATRSAQRRLSPRRRVETVYPGIPLAEVRAWRGRGEAVRARLGWGTAPVVGMVARLSPWKGQRTFLESASLVASQRPDVCFVVVGGALMGTEGNYPEELRRLATSLGIVDRVHFAGHVDAPYAWLDALDVVVHASRGEPFGLVIVEAMALGKPVICSHDGGPLEIIGEAECALTVPPGDARSLGAAIRRALEEPGLAAWLASRAAMRAQAFAEERTAARLAAILTEVVDGRPG